MMMLCTICTGAGMARLESLGYERYEISNYAKAGAAGAGII